MRHRILSMLAIAALAMAAQEPKAKKEQSQDERDLAVLRKLKAEVEPERKIFVLKYADAQDVGNLLNKVFAGGISSNREMKVIVVSGTPALVAAVAEAIAKLDVPPQPARNIEITAYLLVGSMKPEAGSSLPAELESVVKQIKATFPYKEFQLLDSIVMRTQPRGRVSLNGLVATPSPEHPTTYQFKVNSATVSQDDKIKMIRLEGLNLVLRVPIPTVSSSPGGYQYLESGIGTDIDIREGQKVVVGKSSFGSPDKALFLVLTAKVVD